MKKYLGFREFHTRIGILFSFHFDDLPLMPDFFSGGFKPNRLDELLEFCRSNPMMSVADIDKGGEG